MELNVDVEFMVEPAQNHEMFFSYDEKKEKRLSGESKDVPIVKIRDKMCRSGVLKVVCVDHEPFDKTRKKYRLHRHKLVDYLNKTSFCDEFGVAIFPFDSSSYNKDRNEIFVKLENLSIRRINEQELNEYQSKWLKNKNRFDPFGIGFGNLRKKIDLNCVRLCCQVFIDEITTSRCIISNKIQNCKSEIKVRHWIDSTVARSCGGDKFHVFTSELKADQRNIVAVFCDIHGQEFQRVQPDFVHANRALRFTVPFCPFQFSQSSLQCKFYLAVEDRNYKSDFLKFFYIPNCNCHFIDNSSIGDDDLWISSSTLFQNVDEMEVLNQMTSLDNLDVNEFILN